jgi:hypothetical protein
MPVIALSALVLPLGFIAQVAPQHHPASSGEYAKVLNDLAGSDAAPVPVSTFKTRRARLRLAVAKKGEDDLVLVGGTPTTTRVDHEPGTTV